MVAAIRLKDKSNVGETVTHAVSTTHWFIPLQEQAEPARAIASSLIVDADLFSLLEDAAKNHQTTKSTIIHWCLRAYCRACVQEIKNYADAL